MMGIWRSKWGVRAEIWVGQWRADGGGAPRSGTTGRPPGLTSEVPALVGGPEGSLSPYPRWRLERLPVRVSYIPLNPLSGLKIHFHHSRFIWKSTLSRNLRGR